MWSQMNRAQDIENALARHDFSFSNIYLSPFLALVLDDPVPSPWQTALSNIPLRASPERSGCLAHAHSEASGEAGEKRVVREVPRRPIRRADIESNRFRASECSQLDLRRHHPFELTVAVDSV
jgi:hypothetical protein